MKSLNESILNSLKEAFLLEDYKSAKVKLIEKGVSEDEADSLISRHKELKKLNRLDKSLIDIDTLVKNFSPEEIKTKLFNISAQTKSEIKKRIEGKIVAENDEYLVYKIDTPEEAYRFHGLTKWCICSGTEEQARSHFDHYSNGFKNVFYFFVRKNITDPEDDWNYIALQRDKNESQDTYWSTQDRSYTPSGIPVNLPEFDKPPIEPLSAEERLIKDGLKKNADGEFDFDGNFNLKEHKYLIVDGKLSVKFGKVSGDFDCSECEELTSLEGCPEKVGGSFYCVECGKLTDLEGCPKEVGENFSCAGCVNIKSLEGCPKEIVGYFDCGDCKNLINLEGCPKTIGRNFYCYGCINLKTLKGCPENVIGDFSCYGCKNLTSLEWCQKEVGGNFDCHGCENLTSLEGCPEKVGGYFDCSDCKNLTSLEGCPRGVGRNFCCTNCGIKFTEKYVGSLCIVGWIIIC